MGRWVQPLEGRAEAGFGGRFSKQFDKQVKTFTKYDGFRVRENG
jgi:hypothetical protein